MKHHLPDLADRPLTPLRSYTYGPGADVLPKGTIAVVTPSDFDQDYMNLIKEWNDAPEAELSLCCSSSQGSLEDDVCSILQNPPAVIDFTVESHYVVTPTPSESQGDIQEELVAEGAGAKKPTFVETDKIPCFQLVSDAPWESTNNTVDLHTPLVSNGTFAASSNLKKTKIKNRQSSKDMCQKQRCMVAYNPYQPIHTVRQTKQIQTHFRDVDVLCGRGGKSNNHPGNKHYLKLRDEMSAQYNSASRSAKKLISQALVDKIEMLGGRFLKSECNEGPWDQLSNQKAREKAAQALREGKR